VTDMEAMFDDAESFTSDLSKWNARRVPKNTKVAKNQMSYL